jgi:drug/metabolite transporter (DMT)-like permease
MPGYTAALRVSVADRPPCDGMTETGRAILFMVLSMALFALEDMFIKILAGTVPLGQILVALGVGGTLIFGALALRQGDRLWSRDVLAPSVLVRMLGEALGTIGFATAIALTPITSASAIIQAMPLAVTLGAALFLGETVGWRRWTAIVVGFVGVLIVIRPGTEGFEPLSLFAVLGVFGLGMRDLATRVVPKSISSMQLSTYSFAVTVPAGVAWMAVAGAEWVALDGAAWGTLAAAQMVGVLAYAALVLATRTGAVSVVAPFRYSRIVFAMVVGVLVFGERPDVWTLVGTGVIVGSGLYTLWRETRAGRAARRASLVQGAGL